MAKKIYYILINTGLGYTRHYKIKGQEQTFRELGAVISRHRTLEAALNKRALIHEGALGPITTDIVGLHFWPAYDDYIGEEYVGANNFSYRPASVLEGCI